ncbi:MAG: hypothetical protein LBT83_07320, partial [Tannerella sp.]|nr:hypothetical protein [Tannerella sp.]
MKKEVEKFGGEKKVRTFASAFEKIWIFLDKRSLKRFYIKQDVVQEKRGREIGSMLGSDLGGHESVRS